MILYTTALFIVYGLLTAALLAVWLPPSLNRTTRIPVWMLLFGLSALAGWYYGFVDPGGLLYLAALGLLCRLTGQPDLHTGVRVVFGCALAGMAAALFVHRVPFFDNPLVFDAFSFGEESPPYTKRWNFDKAAAGLLLLAYLGDLTRSGRDWLALARRACPVTTLTVVLTVLTAWIAGYIKPALTLTPVFFVWAWANLFFTCVAEEMLFRGFVQKQLTALTTETGYKMAIVVLVGVLFGLAHLAGGPVYAALASVAGIGYGFVYYVTGRIESAILTHFLLNAVHWLLFTYPYANSV